MQLYISDRLRKAMLFLFVCLTAFYISKGLLFIIDSGVGAGNVIRAFFPGILCMVGLLFFARPDLFPLGLRSAKIGLKEGLFLIFISSLVVLFLLPWIDALIRLVFVLIALIGLLTAIYLIVTRDDAWGIVAFFLTEPFLGFIQWDIPFLRSIYDSGFISVSYISMLLIVGAAIVRMLKGGNLVRTTLDKYILAFAMILLLSSITSPDPSESFKMFFQNVIVGMPFFFLVSSRIHAKKDIILLLATLVLYSVLKGLMVNYYLLKGFEFSSLNLIETRGGMASNPRAPLALGGPIPIAISMAIVYSRHSIKRVYYLLAALLFLFLSLVYQGRGSFLVFAVGIPLILFYRQSKRWVLVGLIAAILTILVSGFVPIFFQRYEELMSIHGWEDALAMRLDGWRAALAMIRDHPFTGVGFGMWEEFIHIYGKPFKMVIEGQRIYIYITSAHNGHLHYGAEAGLGALILSFLIHLKAQLTTFSVMKRVKDDCIRTIAVGLAWTYFGMLLGGIDSHLRGYIDHAIVSWGLLAVIMALERISQMDSPLIGDNTNGGRG